MKKLRKIFVFYLVVSKKAGDRFCFHIPEQGAEYVHEHMKPNEFIRELVELVGKHGCTMQQVKDPVSYTHLDVYKRQEYRAAGYFYEGHSGF